MTAVAVLAEAMALGVTLTPDGESIRYKGQLPSDLRKRISELKPELLALLRESPQDETARLWSAAYARLMGVGWPGRELVAQLRPGLLVDIDDAELVAEQLAVAHRAGGESAEAYIQAIGRWESLVREAAATIARLCHDCGREAPAALLDPETGERFCRACVRAGGRP